MKNTALNLYLTSTNNLCTLENGIYIKKGVNTTPQARELYEVIKTKKDFNLLVKAFVERDVVKQNRGSVCMCKMRNLIAASVLTGFSITKETEVFIRSMYNNLDCGEVKGERIIYCLSKAINY